MKIIDKSLSIAYDLFPSSYSSRNHYQTFHFAFIYRRNTLLSIGQNSYNLSGKALKFANRFNTEKTKKYPTLHAEISAISKIFGKEYIDSSMKMVVLRLNKYGEIKNSKPCVSCKEVLTALEIRVWYSKNGHFAQAL